MAPAPASEPHGGSRRPTQRILLLNAAQVSQGKGVGKEAERGTPRRTRRRRHTGEPRPATAQPRFADPTHAVAPLAGDNMAMAETYDIRQRPIAEMIFNDLLQYCDDAPRGLHEEITVRFNLHGATHVAGGGNDRFDEPYCGRDCNEVRSVSAGSGGRAIRAMIEAGLDERCRRLEYTGLEPWDNGDDKLCVHVCWV